MHGLAGVSARVVLIRVQLFHQILDSRPAGHALRHPPGLRVHHPQELEHRRDAPHQTQVAQCLVLFSSQNVDGGRPHYHADLSVSQENHGYRPPGEQIVTLDVVQDTLPPLCVRFLHGQRLSAALLHVATRTRAAHVPLLALALRAPVSLQLQLESGLVLVSHPISGGLHGAARLFVLVVLVFFLAMLHDDLHERVLDERVRLVLRRDRHAVHALAVF